MKPLISDETLKLLEANEAEQQRKTKENIEVQYKDTLIYKFEQAYKNGDAPFVRFDNIMDDNGGTGKDNE